MCGKPITEFFSGLFECQGHQYNDLGTFASGKTAALSAKVGRNSCAHPKTLEISDASTPYRQLIVDIAIPSEHFSSTHDTILGSDYSAYATLEASVILIISIGIYSGSAHKSFQTSLPTLPNFLK